MPIEVPLNAANRRNVILREIANAGRLADRDAHDVTLVAVSKTRSADQIRPLLEAGQLHFGESQVQEAQAKWPSLRANHGDLHLHLIGRLQSNKAVDAVALFDTIHSLDRLSLLNALVSASAKIGRTPGVYVQVNIGEENQKGGVALNELSIFLAAVRASPLPLLGLMAIPPQDAEPAPYFALLAKLAREQGAGGLSMGMSGDYLAAVMLGATIVRVGTAMFED